MKHSRLALYAAILGYGLSVIPTAEARCRCNPPYVAAGVGICIKPVTSVTPETPEPETPITPINYSGGIVTTNGRFQGASIGNMSDGLDGGTAKVAEKGLASVGKTAWCNRGGRSKAMVDVCLKAAGG